MGVRRLKWIVAAAAGVSLACLPLVRRQGNHRAMALHTAPPAATISPSVPLTPSARARREAMKEWWSAQNGVNGQREAMEGWDPAVEAQADLEAWRRQSMADSRGHELQRAAAAAARAQALARTPRERYAASELAWRIAADRGDPGAELAAAQLLVRLEPHNPVSTLALRHALRAGGRRRPAREAEAKPQARRQVARAPASK